jgi:hypothetical protein
MGQGAFVLKWIPFPGPCQEVRHSKAGSGLQSGPDGMQVAAKL